MKIQKINISLIFKIITVVVLSIVFALLVKYYLYYQLDLQQLHNDLNAVIILNDNIEELENVVENFKENSNFNFIEFTDKHAAYAKALETSPDLANIMPNDNKSYFPDYITVNELNAKNRTELESIKQQLISSDTVKDVLYDDKAFELYFKKLDIFNFFRKFLSYIVLIIAILFLVKIVLFVLTKKYLIVLYEVLYGIIAAFLGYVIICILASITDNPFFILNWNLLLYVLPFGAVLTFMTKQANV